MTPRESILAHLATALGAVTAGRFFRTRLPAEDRRSDLAIILRPVREDVDASNAKAHRTLRITIDVVTWADHPDTAMDTCLAQVHAAVFADRQQGGSAINTKEIGTEWSISPVDPAEPAIASLTYDIAYRTEGISLNA